MKLVFYRFLNIMFTVYSKDLVNQNINFICNESLMKKLFQDES